MTAQPAAPPKRVDPAARARKADRRSLWRGGIESLLLHGLLLALLIGLWRIEPAQEIVLPPVTLKIEGQGGSAGTAGGGGGDAARPGEAREADAKLAASAPAEPTAPTPPKPAAVTPLQPKPVPKPVVRIKPPSPPKPQPQPQPIPAVVSPPQPSAPSPSSSATSVNQQSASAAPAGSGSGTEGAGSAGNGNVGSDHGLFGSGHGTGDPDDYLDQLRRWINRYKKYPEDALKKKEEGTVVISFTLAHDGTVTKSWIEKSSGNPELDAAAMQMMHDASPVPAVPPKYWDRTGITVPVDFSISFFNRILP